MCVSERESPTRHKHGAVIVAQGTRLALRPAPSATPSMAFLMLAARFPAGGQSAYYLAAQLRDFASGVRASPIMSGIAKALSPDDIADVTAYFAGIKAPFLRSKRAIPRS